MTQIDEIFKLAESQIGYKAKPDNTNKYNLEYYGRKSGQPWCVVFQWWLFKHTGLSKLFYGGGKTASCSALYDYHKKIGQTVPINEAQKGDLIIFRFWNEQKKKWEEHCHIGICYDINESYVYTIDGNTSQSASQSNGGEVLRRMRGRSLIWGVVRPQYNEAPEPEPKPEPQKEEYYTVQKGDNLTKIAKKSNTTVDWLVEVNNIKDPNKIYVGQILRVK